MSCDCMGCQYEIMECYDWQKRGYDAGGFARKCIGARE